MTKTKIEWADFTWNPVWGCLNTCEYCYARKIAKRFAKNIAYKEFYYNPKGLYPDSNLYWFKPTFLESNFAKPFPKKPSRIFVNSMSDISCWKPEWMERVLAKIKEYPEHKFLFLTKKPEKFCELFEDSTPNCWLGVTLTGAEEEIKPFFYPAWCSLFVSIEPLLDRFDYDKLFGCKWVIIGSETGNRKDRVIPKLEWIFEIVNFCRDNRIPVFMKPSLQAIWKVELIQEFPEGLNETKTNA